MPAILLSPLALRLVQMGAVAAMAVYASRQRSEPKDIEHERVLDDLPEGLAVSSHRAEAERGMHAAGRFRKVLRLRGAGFEIEAAGLGRLRLRRAAWGFSPRSRSRRRRSGTPRGCCRCRRGRR